MLSCTQFIPAYSELFTFLEEREGYDGVMRYWTHVSDQYVEPRLGECLKKSGLAGCFDYWSHSLNEEAADFTMTLDEDAGYFEIEMKNCPSKGMLLSLPDFKPYPRYCEHCDTLYHLVANRYGLGYDYDFSQCDRACCRLRVFDPAKFGAGAPEGAAP